MYLKGCGLGADPFTPSEVGKYDPSVGNPGDAGVCVAREYDIGGLGAPPVEAKATGELMVEDERAGKGLLEIGLEVDFRTDWLEFIAVGDCSTALGAFAELPEGLMGLTH